MASLLDNDMMENLQLVWEIDRKFGCLIEKQLKFELKGGRRGNLGGVELRPVWPIGGGRSMAKPMWLLAIH